MSDDNTNKGIILLVDDHPTNLGVLFESLKESGFKLLVAQDGESAIEQVNYIKPDIILLDVMMPGMDGFETCRRLKANAATENISVIFMTALSEAVDKVKGFNIGAVDYITKPIQPEEVLARVKSHLGVQNLQKQLQSQNLLLQQEIRDRLKAEEALRVFLQAVSHDLRNPVTGTLMVLKNLLKSEEKSSELNTRQHFPSPKVSVSYTVLERMAQSCDRQLSLIDSLLEVYASEVWGVILECQPLQLHTLTQRLIEDWEPMLAKNQVTLKHLVPTDLPLVNVDQNQLWRVFENLIANALKHNPPGVMLTLSAEEIVQESGVINIRCTVSDNGVGMTAEQCDRLFKLYTRGKNTRQTTSLGLGLYLCRQIITAHSGEIGVISSPEAGSTFWFTLPVFS